MLPLVDMLIRSELHDERFSSAAAAIIGNRDHQGYHGML